MVVPVPAYRNLPFPDVLCRRARLSALSRSCVAAMSRLLSLGPDCGVRHRIDEQALPWNRRGPTNLFDWMLSSLTAVVAVLECDNPELYFGADRWSFITVWPSGSYEFVHTPTRLRSLHDARASEYKSVDAARLEVSARYVRRLHRLRQLLEASDSLRFLHVVDNENEMNVHPPPSRNVIQRVRQLIASRHTLVIAHDGNFVSAASLSVAGVALVDTRRFRLHQPQGQRSKQCSERCGEQADEHGGEHGGEHDGEHGVLLGTGDDHDAEEPAGWRRAHLDWVSLLQAVSDAVPPVERVTLTVAIRAEGKLGLDVQVHLVADAPAAPHNEQTHQVASDSA